MEYTDKLLISIIEHNFTHPDCRTKSVQPEETSNSFERHIATDEMYKRNELIS